MFWNSNKTRSVKRNGRVLGNRSDPGSARQAGVQVQSGRGNVERRRRQIQETYRGKQTTSD